MEDKWCEQPSSDRVSLEPLENAVFKSGHVHQQPETNDIPADEPYDPLITSSRALLC